MGFWLLIPFFLLRFGLLALLDKTGIRRAAHFAPLQTRAERAAGVVYQISNLALFILLCFLRLHTAPSWLFYPGAALYTCGCALLLGAVIAYAAPTKNGMHTGGLYRVSRNPMYLAYFFFFVGCVLLTQSLLLLCVLLAFQLSTHWIILSEERWCTAQFGDEYQQYMQKVRRYLGARATSLQKGEKP